MTGLEQWLGIVSIGQENTIRVLSGRTSDIRSRYGAPVHWDEWWTTHSAGSSSPSSWWFLPTCDRSLLCVFILFSSRGTKHSCAACKRSNNTSALNIVTVVLRD